MVGTVNIIAVAVPKGILLIEDAVVVSMPVKKHSSSFLRAPTFSNPTGQTQTHFLDCLKRCSEPDTQLILRPPPHVGGVW